MRPNSYRDSPLRIKATIRVGSLRYKSPQARGSLRLADLQVKALGTAECTDCRCIVSCAKVVACRPAAVIGTALAGQENNWLVSPQVQVERYRGSSDALSRWR